MSTDLVPVVDAEVVLGLDDLAVAIREAHEACEASAHSAVAHAIHAGEYLTEAKAQVRHGEWLPWLEATEIPERMAQRYMRIAANASRVSDLPSVRDALKELAKGDDKTTAERLVASDENEWYTPASYIEAARTVLGAIDLDPASSELANETVGAKTIYTADDNSLDAEWSGRVWLNPPYGRMAGDFAARLINEHIQGNVTAAVLLVNAHCTDTAWFQPLWDYTLCFTDHRIDFDSAGRDKANTSTHGSVFAYLGERPELFTDAFRDFGAVVKRA